jgi:hypothetical protein
MVQKPFTFLEGNVVYKWTGKADSIFRGYIIEINLCWKKRSSSEPNEIISVYGNFRSVEDV